MNPRLSVFLVVITTFALWLYFSYKEDNSPVKGALKAILKFLRHSFTYAATLIPAYGTYILISYIAEENSTNHMGFELYDVLYPLSLLAIIAIILYKINKLRFALVPLMVNLLTISIILFVDYFNIMVQYDRWRHRGMPSPFEASAYR